MVKNMDEKMQQKINDEIALAIGRMQIELIATQVQAQTLRSRIAELEAQEKKAG